MLYTGAEVRRADGGEIYIRMNDGTRQSLTVRQMSEPMQKLKMMVNILNMQIWLIYREVY